jgi:hypothetical protein
VSGQPSAKKPTLAALAILDSEVKVVDGAELYSPRAMLKIMAGLDLDEIVAKHGEGRWVDQMRVFQGRAADVIAQEQIKAHPRPTGDVLWETFGGEALKGEDGFKAMLESLDPSPNPNRADWQPATQGLHTEYHSALHRTATRAIRCAHAAAGAGGAVVLVLETVDKLGSMLIRALGPESPTKAEITQGSKRASILTTRLDRLDPLLRNAGAENIMVALVAMAEIRVLIIASGIVGIRHTDPEPSP